MHMVILRDPIKFLGVGVALGILIFVVILPQRAVQTQETTQSEQAEAHSDQERCWQEQVARMGGAAAAIASADDCRPSPTISSDARPKADLAPLRYPKLFSEFFRDPGTLGLQRRFIAAELADNLQAYRIEIEGILAATDAPLVRWRAEVGLARAALRFGDPVTARSYALTALQTAEADGLDPVLIADPLYVLALTTPERSGAVALLNRAVEADPAYFNAHLILLRLSLTEISDIPDGPRKGRLLLDLTHTLEFFGGLRDRALLLELVLELRQSKSEEPEQALIQATARWYIGAKAEAKAMVQAGLARCGGRSIACERLTVLARAMAEANP